MKGECLKLPSTRMMPSNDGGKISMMQYGSANFISVGEVDPLYDHGM